MTAPLALHVAPHPDDELIPAGGILLSLLDAGWRVLNLAVGLGEQGQHDRRRAELALAGRRSGLVSIEAEPLLRLGRATVAQDQRSLAEQLRETLGRLDPAVVVGPSPHDAHHAHEAVGRAIRDAVVADGRPRTVAFWQLWGDLGLPTTIAPVRPEVVERVVHALEAHAGEVARNDYVDLVRARGRVNRVLGTERVLGFGAAMPDSIAGRHCELLTEVRFDGTGWAFLPSRIMDPERPAFPDPGGGRLVPADWWLASPSLSARAAA